MNKEVKRHIKSIVKTLLFLLIMTLYWYGPRKDISILAANISEKYANRNINVETSKELKLDNKEVRVRVTNKLDKEQGYIIAINNDYYKQRKNNCKIVSNNYLKYSLETADKHEAEKNLNSNSVIYTDVLKPNENKEFSIKVVMDKDDISEDECFYPVIKVSTYNEI